MSRGRGWGQVEGRAHSPTVPPNSAADQHTQTPRAGQTTPRPRTPPMAGGNPSRLTQLVAAPRGRTRPARWPVPSSRRTKKRRPRPTRRRSCAQRRRRDHPGRQSQLCERRAWVRVSPGPFLRPPSPSPCLRPLLQTLTPNAPGPPSGLTWAQPPGLQAQQLGVLLRHLEETGLVGGPKVD